MLVPSARELLERDDDFALIQAGIRELLIKLSKAPLLWEGDQA